MTVNRQEEWLRAPDEGAVRCGPGRASSLYRSWTHTVRHCVRQAMGAQLPLASIGTGVGGPCVIPTTRTHHGLRLHGRAGGRDHTGQRSGWRGERQLGSGSVVDAWVSDAGCSWSWSSGSGCRARPGRSAAVGGRGHGAGCGVVVVDLAVQVRVGGSGGGAVRDLGSAVEGSVAAGGGGGGPWGVGGGGGGGQKRRGVPPRGGGGPGGPPAAPAAGGRARAPR